MKRIRLPRLRIAVGLRPSFVETSLICSVKGRSCATPRKPADSTCSVERSGCAYFEAAMVRATFVEVAGGDFGDSDSEWCGAPVARDACRESDHCPGMAVGGKRCRSLSDPTTSTPATPSLRFGGTTVFRPQEGDSSDTDVEGDLSAHKQPLLCYSHIRDDCDDACVADHTSYSVLGKAARGSAKHQFSPADEAVLPSSERATMPQLTAAPPSNVNASSTGCGTSELERKALELQQEIQRLSSEHMRLAQENSMLLQRCQQQVQPESHFIIPQMPTLAMQMPYTSAGATEMPMMSAVQVPMCAPSPAQMVCFAPILMQQVSADGYAAEGYNVPMGSRPMNNDEPLAPGSTGLLRQQPQRRLQQQQQQSRHAQPTGLNKLKGGKTRRAVLIAEIGGASAALESGNAGFVSKEKSKSSSMCGAEAAATACAGNEASETDPENRTTVMLRNLPNNYTRDMLLGMIDEGFVGQYDFVYMPVDFSTRASLGYAFINLTSHQLAVRFWRTFEGYCNWVIPSRKRCRVSWSHPFQGLEENVNHYRNSPVMHEVVPSDFKPVIFVEGQMQPLPPPTKGLRAPRLRNYNAATASLNVALRA